MQIAIIGCGWLGLPLGLSLQQSGHRIVATSRSEAGCARVNSLGLTCLQFELGTSLTNSKFAAIFNSNLLILNIPVGRKTATSEVFSANMDALLRQVVDSKIQQVIFISTSSVYGDQNGVVSEKSPTSPNTRSAQINLEVERLVQDYFAPQCCILRLAGLVGKDRHPVNYLAGKSALTAPKMRVNLVHQEDVIQSIRCIIENRVWGDTLVLSATEHPTRQEYYTWAAERLNLAPPVFNEEQEPAVGKLIDPTRSLNLLGMTLNYPSPYDML